MPSNSVSIDRFLDLRRRVGRRVRRKLAERSEKVVRRPRDELRRALRRHGPDGERADDYLCDASRQLNRSGPKQGEIAAFALREAAMALINLGGPKPFELRPRAEQVITRWRLLRDETGSEENLDEAINELEKALPDGNELRLENALRIITRRKPIRGDADLLSEFIKNLAAANHGLHSRIDCQEAARLYKRSIKVIDSLFGPIGERFESIDRLLAIGEPSPEDVVQLLALVGDDRHLLYFFEKVEGSGWMEALAEEPILHPPKEGGWPAGPYLFRIADSDPDLVREWLTARAEEDLSAQQAGFLLRIALRLEGCEAGLVANLALGNFDSLEVQFQVENYLSSLSDRDLDQQGLRRLVIESLKALLKDDHAAMDRHLATKIIEVVQTALVLEDQKAWLQILVHRLRELAENESEFRLRAILPLEELRVDSRSRSGLELIAAAVREAAAAAADAGLDSDEVIEVLEKLEEPLRGRFVAQYLFGRGAADVARAERFLLAQINENPRPSPEELALLRAAFGPDDASFAAAVREALGPAPSAAEIGQLSIEQPMPEEQRRPHSWLVAVPEGKQGDWAEADRLLTERFAPASRDGVMLRVGPARFGGATTPIPREALAVLEPEESARKIGEWEPPADQSLLDPSAEGLAAVLTEMVEQESERWLDVDPRRVIAALGAPNYVSAYFDGLEKALDRIERGHVGPIVAAIAEVQSSSEDARAAGEEDADAWTYAASRGIRLIRHLRERDLLEGEAFEQAWETTVAAVRRRDRDSDSDGDLMTMAINRPWSSALETAFGLGGSDQGFDPRLLELLGECLKLGRPEGELARAIIGSRLPLLHHYAPEWFATNEALLLGDSAPEDLGEVSFAIYLEWGQPYKPILAEQRARVIAALDGPAAEFALRHLLHGLTWSMDDFGATEVATVLADRPELFSEAARWLALSLDEASHDRDPAIALWREALGRELDAEAYAGWGWFALNTELDGEVWLDLTLQAAERDGVNLAEPEEIAKRAEAMAPDERVLRLVSLLLDADPKSWELEEIGAVGLRLLRLDFGAEAQRNELRERLLERGFHDATDIA